MSDAVRLRVLDAVADGRLPRGGPSHLAALNERMTARDWEAWNARIAERIRVRPLAPFLYEPWTSR